MLYRDDDVVGGDAVPTLHLHLQLALLPPGYSPDTRVRDNCHSLRSH